MSVESCTAFLERAGREPELRQLAKAMTDMREIIALGRRAGYEFDLADVVAASPPAEPAAVPVRRPAPPMETTVCHHEVDLADVPGLRPVLDELPHLTIRPPTVDLDAYRSSFRADDLAWTSTSPATAGFRGRYEEVMASHWGNEAPHEFGRRDFHLVNLDAHVDHELYPAYFDAKARTIAHLEAFFEDEVRFSGSMWYPPFAYRLWHTNEDAPGWRMYLIDLDEEVEAGDALTFFRYMDPHTGEVVTLADRRRVLRFFRVEQREDRLFWHCIVNGAARNRWSFGFVVPDDWMTKLDL